MNFSNVKIGRKLTATFALIILLVLAMSGIVLKSLQDIGSAIDWNIHTYAVLERGNGIIGAMVDQETGLRGFLVAGEDKFLEPYRKGQERFASDWAALKSLTSDNPAQQQRLDDIKHAAESWRNDVAEPEIALMRNPASREQARGLEASGAGKAAMDKIRALQSQFDGAERSLLVIRTATKDSASNFAFWSMIVGPLVLTVLAILLGRLLTATIARPVAMMADAMERLAAGDNSVVVPCAGQKDEVGAMATAVTAFKTAAIEKLRLEADARSAGRLTEEERVRNAAVAAEAASRQAHVVEVVADGLSRLSSGDLAREIDEIFPADYQRLRSDFNAATAKLRDTMRVVTASASAIRSGSGEISSASSDLARRTEQQAASLEQTAAALDEITATVRKTAEGAKHARSVVGATRSSAEQSGDVVRKAVDAMSGIERSSREISQIIGVIDEIAFQTNLLALNAGVEAARAGDAGRGFAVVASEVRALAQRSAEAAKEIKALISTSGQQVEHGVTFVGQTGEALSRIVAQVAEVDGIVGEISASAQEQASALDQVNTAVNQMDQVTQQNAAMVEEANAAGNALATEAGELARIISQFRLGEGHGSFGAASPAATRIERRPSAQPVAALRTTGRGGAARQVAPPAADAEWAEF